MRWRKEVRELYIAYVYEGMLCWFVFPAAGAIARRSLRSERTALIYQAENHFTGLTSMVNHDQHIIVVRHLGKRYHTNSQRVRDHPSQSCAPQPASTPLFLRTRPSLNEQANTSYHTTPQG